MSAVRCPYVGCENPLEVVGSVFCEAGEYDIERDSYDAEGDATVYGCKRADGQIEHTFALDAPYVIDEDEVEGEECECGRDNRECTFRDSGAHGDDA